MSDTANEMPDAGHPAPEFEGETQRGDTIRLSDLRGKKVALYFYPKDDTPGCTKQACNLRDDYQGLLEHDIAVVGVSADDVASHRAFAEKYDLPFPLVADTNKEIVKRYGVWGRKNLFGKRTMGVKRTTFLIDEGGTIVYVFRRPTVEEHSREITEKFGLAWKRGASAGRTGRPHSG